MKVQRYKHDLDISYALGATLTFELLLQRPDLVTRVFLSSATERSDAVGRLLDVCRHCGVPVETNDKAFNILSPKGNCFVIGEFQKFSGSLSDASHIVLVNPSDAGNLGTILRTAAGFGVTDVAIVRPAVDAFDPKVVRASMGAIFHTEIEYFDAIEDYRARFPQRHLYAFMLKASTPLPQIPFEEPCSLVFGNEATGLPDCFADFCTPVIIRHSHAIDSLNLPMAAGIAMYEFTKDRWK